MCPFDEKVNLLNCYSVDDCNRAMEEVGIGHDAVIYSILVYASENCPETNVGKDKAMSMTNPYHGYMYWWLMEQFLLHAVQRSYFTVNGLSTEDGTSEKPSSFDRMSTLANKKKHEQAEAIEGLGGTLPNLYEYFFKDPEGRPAVQAEVESEEENGDYDVPFADATVNEEGPG